MARKSYIYATSKGKALVKVFAIANGEDFRRMLHIAENNQQCERTG